jgi:[protein-PII] uridylyltransferase
MAIDHRLDKKRKYGFSGNAGLPPTAPRVCLEENGSDFFSVIEVVCDDREGLLYEIARTMQELQLDIVFARIATRKDQVLDVFYVRDRFGEKITDPGQKEEIVRAIEYRIAGAQG